MIPTPMGRRNCSELMWRIARRLLKKYGAPIFRLC
jgi:hypothetical protein